MTYWFYSAVGCDVKNKARILRCCCPLSCNVYHLNPKHKVQLGVDGECLSLCRYLLMNLISIGHILKCWPHDGAGWNISVWTDIAIHRVTALAWTGLQRIPLSSVTDADGRSRNKPDERLWRLGSNACFTVVGPNSSCWRLNWQDEQLRSSSAPPHLSVFPQTLRGVKQTSSLLFTCCWSHKTTWLFLLLRLDKRESRSFFPPSVPLQQQTLMFTSCLSGCSHHDPTMYHDKAFLFLWFTSRWESATPSFSFPTWENICSFLLLFHFMFQLFLHFMINILNSF